MLLRRCEPLQNAGVINKCCKRALKSRWPSVQGVNMRKNAARQLERRQCFLSRAHRILNNNDFLMWNCDYIVMVRYGSSRPHWK